MLCIICLPYHSHGLGGQASERKVMQRAWLRRRVHQPEALAASEQMQVQGVLRGCRDHQKHSQQQWHQPAGHLGEGKAWGRSGGRVGPVGGRFGGGKVEDEVPTVPGTHQRHRRRAISAVSRHPAEPPNA